MRNKIVALIGVCLVIIGGLAIGIEQISYTRHEKVLEIGPIEATVAKEAHCYRLPVIFGILTIASGLALVVIGIKKRS